MGAPPGRLGSIDGEVSQNKKPGAGPGWGADLFLAEQCSVPAVGADIPHPLESGVTDSVGVFFCSDAKRPLYSTYLVER